MKKICITGAWYSSRNIGDQAILFAINELLSNHLNKVELTVIGADDEFIKSTYSLNAVSQFKNLFQVFSTVIKSDLLLIGGGTPFYDDFKHMAYFFILTLLNKIAGKKTAIYGASSQKLNTWYSIFFTKLIVKLSNMITLREELTTKYFKEELNIKKRVITTCDPAITLPDANENDVDEVMRKEGLNNIDKPLFGICPHYFSNKDKYRVHHYEFFSNSCIENQIKVLAETVDYLSQKGIVVFIPMNIDRPDSDIDASEQILKYVKNSNYVKVINSYYHPYIMKSIFKRMKLIIGVRLHSLVLSASALTPFVAIEYAPKVSGFVQLIKKEEYGCEINGLSFEKLKVCIETCLSNYDEYKNDLSIQTKKLEETANFNAKIITDLINKGN